MRSGKYAQKFVHSGSRTESTADRFPVKKIYWYGWSMFVPENWRSDATATVSQLAGYQPPCHGGANFHLKIHKDKWGVWLRNMASMKGDRLGLLPVRKGVWTDIVVHCKFTPENDGFFKIWIDGKKLIDLKGSSWVNCPKGPYFKAGLYAGAPGGSVIYMDEHRMAGEEGLYTAVCPGKEHPTSTEIPAPALQYRQNTDTPPGPGLIAFPYAAFRSHGWTGDARGRTVSPPHLLRTGMLFLIGSPPTPREKR